ncbi:MAG: helix-turn-helix transcriptional regulator [Roseburia sp.]|nr:helix-turn-helix transcriptional regulator [Roseburia sp.]
MGKEEIALKLKQARTKSNMTQKEVADILGMTYQAISNYERGKTKVESNILVKLCQIYNISVPEILSDGNELQAIKKAERSSTPDLQLEKIIEFYTSMNKKGKQELFDQAEYLLGKYPKQKATNTRAI